MSAAGIATIERMSIKENHLFCDDSPTPMALMMKGMMTALSEPGIMASATFLNNVSLSRSLESRDARGIISIMGVMGVLPSLFIAAFMPALTKRFDKFEILMVGVAGQTVMSIVTFFVGYENKVLFLTCMLIRWMFFRQRLESG